jgi:ribA/ribD-fused uncharacterized protein
MTALTIQEHPSQKYAPRTEYNAKAAGLTVAFALDFSTMGERLTRRVAGEKYLAIDLNMEPIQAARELYKAMRRHSATSINVAGNGIYTLQGQGWSQARIDRYVSAVLGKVAEHLPIKLVVSGGQTGVDIAGVTAAHALGIPAVATLPKGFVQRGAAGKDSTHTREEIESQIKQGAAALLYRQSEMPAPAGTIRVVSKRKGGDAATADEVVVDGDRNNPTLGNPFHLDNWKDETGRTRVLQMHQREVLEPDILLGGPIYKEMERLAIRVRNGERIALACWCKPLPCHLDAVAEGVMTLASGRDLRRETLARVQERGFEFFFGNEHPFSNWHQAMFEVDGVGYSCMEQFMMLQKATLFGDLEIAGLIMTAKSAREHKALGRQVKGFDEAVWREHREQIVLNGALAKFGQNDDLLKALLATGQKLLVEASPYDTIWGIGMSKDDPRATNPGQWPGQNLLGNILGRARDILREEFEARPKQRILKMGM